jgi:hypothetical protein
VADVKEVLTAFTIIITLMIEAVRTSETSAAQRNIQNKEILILVFVRT